MVLFCSIIRLRRSMLQQNLSKNTKNASPRSGMPEHAKSNRTGVKYATCSSCRSASRSEQRGHRCQESSACRCRTVALRAHVNEHVIFLASGAGHEGVAARARHLNGVIIRMDTLLHFTSPMDSGTRVVMPLWQDVNRNLRDCTRLSGREDALRRRRRRRKEWGRRGLNPGPGDYESHALTD